MIFTPENALKILRGKKNQTRRIVQDGEAVVGDEQGTIYRVLDANGRVKWRVGHDYAVQPGRGKHAICRVQLAEIRQEYLQEINWEDAWNEGCSHVSSRPPVLNFRDLWDSINTTPGTRWADNPLVWVLVFGAVTERYGDRIAALEMELQEYTS